MVREDVTSYPGPFAPPRLVSLLFPSRSDSGCPSGSVQWQTAHFLRLRCQQKAHPLLNHTDIAKILPPCYSLTS